MDALGRQEPEVHNTNFSLQNEGRTVVFRTAAGGKISRSYEAPIESFSASKDGSWVSYIAIQNRKRLRFCWSGAPWSSEAEELS